jgi:hypothetical protein
MLDRFKVPLGATRGLGSHKGYGLALMGETLATLLSGILPFGLDRSTGTKHLLAAYNIPAYKGGACRASLCGAGGILNIGSDER